MKKIDLVAISVMIAVAFLIAGVIVIGNRIPMTVSCQPPDGCTQVSPFGSVVFAFSRPVQPDQVEALWRTVPPIEGKFEWLDDHHVRWNALQPLPSDQTIVLQFISGQAGQNGEQIDKINRWEVTVRSPLIVAVGINESNRELFVFGLDGKTSGTQLTHSEGRLYDFSPSPDGEMVAFSTINDIGGIDLWTVQRDGTNQRKILDCGADRCSAPAWSPIAMELAYTRESAGLDPNGPKGAPRTWILDVNSTQTAPLFTDPQKIGYGPKWSPDGQWLSIWNGLQGGIEVVNRETGETMLLESSNGEVGSWTSDSQFLYYADVASGEAGFRNVVYRADIKNGSISTILGGNVEGEGLSVDHPVCNPQENWVAVKIQPNVTIPGAELVLLHPDSKSGISIMDDVSRIPGFYSWTPDGDYLVYQLDVLGGDGSDVEIWAWSRNAGEAIQITEGYRLPYWLP